MKQLTFSLLISLTLLTSLFSQDANLSTFGNGDLVLNETHGPAGPLEVNTYWYIVRDDDGFGSTSITTVKNIISAVKTIYQSHNIILNDDCGGSDPVIINNTTLSNADASDICLFENEALSDGLNVFFTDDLGGFNGSAYLVGNFCAIATTSVDILAHEIGHCFGLFHTGRPYLIRYDQDGDGFLGNDDYWECDLNGLGEENELIYYHNKFKKCDGSINTEDIPFEFVNPPNNVYIPGVDFVEDTPPTMEIPFGNLGACDDYYDCSNQDRCNDVDDDLRRDPQCDEYFPNTNYDNFMHVPDPGCRDHFTEGQGSRMRGVINDFLGHLLIGPPKTHKIVSSNETWNNDRSYASITIEPNVSLTINNSIVEIEGDGGVIIKEGAYLDLNNSTLKPCGYRWKGVRIENENKSNLARIDLYNSNIQRAEVGIKIGDIPIGNSSVPKHYGQIYSWFSTFESNVVAIQVAEDDPSLPYHYIIANSFLNNIKFGIRAYNNNRVLGYGNLFDGNKKTGIEITDSYIRFGSNNAFRNGENGIRIFGTYPGSAGMILGSESVGPFGGFNIFENLEYSLLGYASDNILGLDVYNTTFEDITMTGSALLGSSRFNFKSNTYDNSPYGFVGFITGASQNSLNCNNFINQTNAASFWGDNPQSQFLENNFSSISTAEFFLNQARVHNPIGFVDNPAGNCFSNTGDDIHQIGGASFEYNYFKPVELPIPCQEPFGIGTWTKFDTPVEPSHCDGFNRDPLSYIDPNNDSKFGLDTIKIDSSLVCFQCIQDSITYWINQVVLLGGDNITTSINESTGVISSELSNSKNILSDWINYGLFVSIQTKDYNFGESILQPLKPWLWKKKLFGFYVATKNVSVAASYLSTLPDTNQNQINFNYVQRINVKRLMQDSINQTEIDSLATLAQENFESNGYARSIYYILTDSILPVDFAWLTQSGSARFSFDWPKHEFLDEEIILFPNPASDMINISVKNTEQIKEARIYSIGGNSVRIINSLNNYNSIEISDFEEGIYYLVLRTKDEQLIPKMFYVQKH